MDLPALCISTESSRVFRERTLYPFSLSSGEMFHVLRSQIHQLMTQPLFLLFIIIPVNFYLDESSNLNTMLLFRICFKTYIDSIQFNSTFLTKQSGLGRRDCAGHGGDQDEEHGGHCLSFGCLCFPNVLYSDHRGESEIRERIFTFDPLDQSKVYIFNVHGEPAESLVIIQILIQ